MAEKIYGFLTSPRGFTPKARLDIAGARKVLELRSEYGQPQKRLSDPARYYDPQYFEAAVR